MARFLLNLTGKEIKYFLSCLRFTQVKFYKNKFGLSERDFDCLCRSFKTFASPCDDDMCPVFLSRYQIFLILKILDTIASIFVLRPSFVFLQNHYLDVFDTISLNHIREFFLREYQEVYNYEDSWRL